MTIEEMIARKKELGHTNKTLAHASGVPLGTVQKIFAGVTKAPRAETIRALTEVLERPGRATYTILKGVEGKNRPNYFVRETISSYAAPEKPLRRKLGPYTLDDYYALPDDRRVELIDGFMYDMAAPNRKHQDILGELHFHFKNCIQNNHASCKVYFAPFDVQLDCDQYTMVKPDLVLICQQDRLVPAGCHGAPDLVIEILSESTKDLDLFIKLFKYWNAGVREYWIVDPARETVLVYFFETSLTPESYQRNDAVPVGISGGRCSIDMKEIFDSAADPGKEE